LERIADAALVESLVPGNAMVRTDPWKTYQRLRREGPVVWSPGLRTHVTFTHEAAREVLASADFVAEHPFRASRRALGPTILDVEGEAHRRLRRMVRGPLAVAALRREASHIDSQISEVVEQLPAGVPVDLVGRLAMKLPMLVMCALLSLPGGSADWLSDQTAVIVSYLDGQIVSLARVRQAKRNLNDYLRSHMFHDEAPDGALTQGVRTAVHDGTVSLREAYDNIVFLLVAGTASSACGIANTLTCVLDRSDRYSRLVDDPAFAVAATRESLRLETPVQFVPRFAAVDTTVGGTPIRAGQAVQACLSSANRDEAIFDEPDSWRPERANLDQILSFGHGRHSCLGGALGEHELVTLLQTLTARFPIARTAAPLERPEGWIFRRPPRLTVMLHRTGGR
jgi:cytochrome P450